MQKFIEKHSKSLVAIILFFMAVVSLLNAKNDSAIFDETAHIGASYSYVTQHEIRLNPEHPPLIKDLSGLALLPLSLNFNVNQPFWTGELPRKWDEGQWASGKSLLYESENNADQILFWSRLPIILISLLLGWFIFRWTKSLAGTMAGLFALILYAFDPNILGHNHFVTTDLGIAASFVFSFYFYLRFIKEPSWKNVFLAGIFLGILQLTKFSFIVGLPIMAIVTIIYPLVRKKRDPKESTLKFKFDKLEEYFIKGIAVFFISLAIVWIGYFANTFKMSKETVSESIDFNFPAEQTQNIKEVYTRKLLVTLNENSVTRPLVIYGEGIGYVFRRVAGGNGAYFMEKVSSTAFPAYFPTVFILKEPLINLFFMAFALSLTLFGGIKFILHKFSFHFGKSGHDPNYKHLTVTSFIRHNIISLSFFAFICLYAYVSITGNLNIGFRHLFPILPFAYILTAKVIFDFWKRMNWHSQKVWLSTITVLVFLLIFETASAYPAYMSYFNQIAGGPKNGYRFVTDSNADWGQDLKRLKLWIEKYNWCEGNSLDSFCRIYDEKVGPIEKIHVNYFGGGDIYYYLGDTAIDWWDSKRPIEPDWYAISTNFLMGSIYDKTKPDSESYRWTKKFQPVAQVGTSIFIYYLTPGEIQKAGLNVVQKKPGAPTW